MFSGLKRFHASGQSHFVTFCCYHRRPSFVTEFSKQTFEVGLERVRDAFGLCVYGYVVMPEHIHLLLNEPKLHTLTDAQIAEARRLEASDRKRGSFLAEALLRFQCTERAAIYGEAALHPSQSGEAWIMRERRRLALEQLSAIRNGLRGESRD